ncbi:MAG: DUF4493 domain-containing protein [Bacteroides sp.]|nr:DUF4493 domain-containing protein [Bacteroides sp.]
MPSDDELLATCVVTVTNSAGEVEFSGTGTSALTGVSLSAGNYKVTVEAGEEVPGSFDKIYYKGETDITVVAGTTTPVTVICTIQNTIVRVIFSDDLKAKYSGYEVHAFTSTIFNDPLVYNANRSGENYDGYFTLSGDESIIGWTFVLDDYQETGSVPAKPATRYTLTYTLEEGSGTGNGIFNLSVIEEPIKEITDEVGIYHARPKIEGKEFNGEVFDINEPILLVKNSSENVITVEVTTALPLTNITLGIPKLGTSLPLDFPLADELLSELAQEGIELDYDKEANPLTSVLITFTELIDIIAGYANEGEVYDVHISATDSKVRTTEKQLNLEIVTSSVTPPNITIEPKLVEEDIWAKRATLYATVEGSDATDPIFSYRRYGTSTWATVTGTRDGNTLVAQVSGLLDAATYEYCVEIEGISSDIIQFTTEEAIQLPNSSFEHYYTSSRKIYFNEQGGEMFWDSGNSGTGTYGVNATTFDTTYKHEGLGSAKLASTVVNAVIITKFAAGNIFAGQYKSTSIAPAGANIDWGRPFTSRPAKLTGWYRYETGTINYTDKTLTEEMQDDIAANDNNDIATIFVALGDWDNVVSIKSQNRPDDMFYPLEDDHVIAYGAFERRTSTTVDNMEQFEINLEYFHPDRKPTHII